MAELMDGDMVEAKDSHMDVLTEIQSGLTMADQ